jgi:hypothetical protein
VISRNSMSVGWEDRGELTSLCFIARLVFSWNHELVQRSIEEE